MSTPLATRDANAVEDAREKRASTVSSHATRDRRASRHRRVSFKTMDDGPATVDDGKMLETRANGTKRARGDDDARRARARAED